MATTAADIQELYIAYFGRPADPSGLDYWTQIANQQGLQKTANFFGTTPEFKARVGSLSTEQAINTFYVNLFGRQADAAGLLFWTNKVQTGVFSLEDAGFFIANNTSPADATILSNKVESAQLWTKNLDTTDEILAFNTQGGQAAGITFLTGIVNTPATEAQTTAAILQMVKDSGGSEAGITFNQVAAGAVLTSNINTNNILGPGFTPANKFLTNANDTVVLNGLGGAFVQDTFGTDSDIAKLQAAAVANALIGIETIRFEGEANFFANTVQGVKSIEFNNFQNQGFGVFGQASTAVVTLNSRSQFVTLNPGGVNPYSAVNVTIGDANQGTLFLGGQGSSITFTVKGSAVTQFSFNNGSNLQTLNVFAGSAQTNGFRFNLGASAGTFTAGGMLSAGGDFTLALANANALVNAASQGGVLSFNDGGVSTIALNAFGGGLSANLTVVSGLDRLYIQNTQGGNAQLSANINANMGNFTLTFETALLSQAFSGAIAAAGAITLSAQGVSGSSDVLNLNFASFSGFSLGNRAVVASGFETLNLNIFNNTGSFAIDGGFNTPQATTFRLVANGDGSVQLGSAGTTALTTFSLSQADGSINFSVVSAIASGVQLAAVLGSGNDIINLRNIVTAAPTTFTAYSAFVAGLNTVDISDGGADVILVGYTGAMSLSQSNFGEYQRASIAGFGIGDVLSFTQQVAGATAAAVSVLTALNVATISAGLSGGNIGLFFDGTDTLVFFSGSGVSADADAPASLAAVLRGGNFATVARWNLNNQGALQLIA